MLAEGSKLNRLPGMAPLVMLLFLLCALGLGVAPAAVRTVVIGDSLSAEYDSLPGVPGVDDPTAYAAVTVAGWESRSWVEALGALRPAAVNFGATRSVLPGWNDLRFTGYEFNFAIPGFTAAQYKDIVTSSILSHQEYLTYRLTLSDVLKQQADACVVWLGGNEFRANYGSLCNGADPAPLVQDLQNNIREVLNFVRNQSATVRIILVNLPDLGACPVKQQENPDPAKRLLATQATILANQAITVLALSRNIPVVDVFASTQRIIQGQRTWFGPVDIRNQSDPDNDPRAAFTREGLHPNTPLQIEIARSILASLGPAMPPISDGEALALLGISPQQPYIDWAATRLSSEANGMAADPDCDGLPNLLEYLFDLDPKTRSVSPITFSVQPGALQASYRPAPDRTRLASIALRWSSDLASWSDVPADNLSTASDGRVTVRFQSGARSTFLRLQATVLPVP